MPSLFVASSPTPPPQKAVCRNIPRNGCGFGGFLQARRAFLREGIPARGAQKAREREGNSSKIHEKITNGAGLVVDYYLKLCYNIIV